MRPTLLALAFTWLTVGCVVGGRSAGRYPVTNTALMDQATMVCRGWQPNPAAFSSVAQDAPGKSNRELFATLRKRSPNVSVVIEDVPPPVVIPGVPVVGATRVRLDGASGPAAEELRARVQALVTLKGSLDVVTQLCHVQALQRAARIEIDAMYDQSLTDPAREREASKETLALMKRQEQYTAATVGLVAMIQAAARGGDAAQVDVAARAALADANAPAPVVTQEDVDAFWALAHDKAKQIDDTSKTWGPKEGVPNERARRALLGLSGGEGPGGGRGGAGAPPGMFGAVAGGSAGGGAEGGAEGDVATIAHALVGLLHGDVGAVMKGAALIFPKESPIRAVLTAGGALLKGDVATAIESASVLVPKDSAFGAALAGASALMKSRR